jgi:hypothetical protein
MDEKNSTSRNLQQSKSNHPVEKSPDPLFECSDLYLSAFLKSRGVLFEGHKRGEGKRVIFVFQRQSDFEALLKSYYNDGPVPVLSFKSALRNLRDIIFGEARS